MNYIFAFLALLAGSFVVAKVFFRPAPPPAPLTCPSAPPTALSEEVKSFIQARLRGQNPSGSMADLADRVAKIKQTLIDMRRSGGGSASELGEKISEFERFLNQQKEAGNQFMSSHAKGEFRRLANSLTTRCRPKDAANRPRSDAPPPWKKQ